MVSKRWDHRLAARVDPSDVVQDAMLDVHEKLSEYLRKRPLPLSSWLWQLVREQLVRAKRVHLFAKKRAARKEVKLSPGTSTAGSLLERLMATTSTPSQQVIREEERTRVNQAVERLTEDDRRLLELRYVEGRSLVETARELGIENSAARMRHLRALRRLRALMNEQSPGEVS